MDNKLIQLRNKISTILFENKHDIKQGTYKILYETLAEQTQDIEETVFVECTFIHTCLEDRKYCEHCDYEEEAYLPCSVKEVRIVPMKREHFDILGKTLDEDSFYSCNCNIKNINGKYVVPFDLKYIASSQNLSNSKTDRWNLVKMKEILE